MEIDALWASAESHVPIAQHAEETLQSIVSRNVNPQDSAVVTIGHIGGGHAHKPEVQASFAKRVPLQRMAHTDEVKGLALLLASRASSFITGAQFVIDGGFTLGMVE